MRTAEEECAFGIHLLLAAGHALSAYWNFRKAQKVDRWVAFHALAAGLDIVAVRTHYQRIKDAP